jgi:hypothetical protein
MFLVIPGFVLGSMQLMQINIYDLGVIVFVIGLAGAALSVSVWATSPVNAVTASKDHPFTRTTEETSFVTVWVIAAYLAYEYAYAFFGLNLASLAEAAWIFIPLLAILVGFVPGCGPQILVTTGTKPTKIANKGMKIQAASAKLAKLRPKKAYAYSYAK